MSEVAENTGAAATLEAGAASSFLDLEREAFAFGFTAASTGISGLSDSTAALFFAAGFRVVVFFKTVELGSSATVDFLTLAGLAAFSFDSTESLVSFFFTISGALQAA
jgi:hypothetical protein